MKDLTPSHTAVLFAFNDLHPATTTLSVEEVAKIVNIPPGIVRRRLHFWVQNSVLSVHNKRYAVVEVLAPGTQNNATLKVGDDDDADEFAAFSAESVSFHCVGFDTLFNAF